MPKTYRITLKGHDHTTMFSGTIHVEEISQVPTAAVHPVQGTATPAPTAGSSSRDTDPRMTEPQRRYLFRLFAAQGVAPKQAEERIKTQCRVATLKAITKADASQLIERMIAEAPEQERPTDTGNGRG